jgi:UDP-GlcNAc:undecaprenyl-phosphate GlcNAc-1-phosphate transferase
MRTYLIAFLLSMVCALVATPLVRRLAMRLGAMDNPGERRIHKAPIPRMGGLAVALAFSMPLIGLSVYQNDISTAFYQDLDLVVGLVLGSLIILGLGIYDDLKGARAPLKLLLQSLAALVCYKFGYQVTFITNPLAPGEVIELGLLSLPVTMLWMVGLMNAVNLIDGIDGLASGVTFFACVTLFILCLDTGNTVSAVTVVCLGGAIVGFLFFNFNPATIFLGDTGSLFLGFLLGAVSISGSLKGYALFSILVPAMALGVPILDISLALLRRFLTGRPLMAGDHHHIHHRLLQLGLSQKQVVLTLYSLCALLAMVSLATVYLHSRAILAIIFIALAGFMIVFMRYLGYVEHIKAGRRGLALQELFVGISERSDHIATFRHTLGHVRDVDGLWGALVELYRTFNLISMRLEIHGGALLGEQTALERVLEGDENLQDQPLGSVAMLDLPLGHDAPLGRLIVFWRQDGGEAHPKLYQLYFELVKAELDRVLDAAPVRTAMLEPLLSEHQLR